MAQFKTIYKLLYSKALSFKTRHKVIDLVKMIENNFVDHQKIINITAPEYLKTRRLQRNLSIRDVESETDIARNVIHSYERGSCNINGSTALKLINYYQYPYTNLSRLLQERKISLFVKSPRL